MVTPVKDTAAMISGMSPQRVAGAFVFVSLAGKAPAALLDAAQASYREAEGLSLIVPVEVAKAHGFDTSLAMACITLQVHSALDGVGLTAAVAQALAQADIPCNMVAAFHHDHAYVPQAQAEAALRILTALQA